MCFWLFSQLAFNKSLHLLIFLVPSIVFVYVTAYKQFYICAWLHVQIYIIMWENGMLSFIRCIKWWPAVTALRNVVVVTNWFSY